MKIQAIQYNDYGFGIKKSVVPSFKGYVNGNYYRDEIIKLAKEYMYDANWKKILREDKESIGKAMASWQHKIEWGDCDEDHDNYSRVFLGIFTLGASEVVGNVAAGISAKVKNNKIENMINEIAKCMDDLLKS